MAFLELVDLVKNYGATAVVNRVNLAIEQGKVVCLLGPSGCGKTTTLRLIAGFVTPDAGEIRVGGRVISNASTSEPPERRNMSMIFQSYALWPHMTVFENVAYGLRLRRLAEGDVRAQVGAILEVTKLTPLAERFPGELSGGQQQRVSLARALVVKPQILLLDEPLSNLDANLREEMRFEIRGLHDRYRYTTVYVTHDQTEAMTTADVIVVMNQGSIEQIGTPDDIYRRPRSEFVARFIGGTNIFRGISCRWRDSRFNTSSRRGPRPYPPRDPRQQRRRHCGAADLSRVTPRLSGTLAHQGDGTGGRTSFRRCSCRSDSIAILPAGTLPGTGAVGKSGKETICEGLYAGVRLLWRYVLPRR